MHPVRLLILSAYPELCGAGALARERISLRALLLTLAETPPAPARDNIRGMKMDHS